MKLDENRYVAPAAVAVEIVAEGILCLSGNESMREIDLDDGGFSEE